MADSGISVYFIEKLRQAQFALHCERGMRDVEISFRQREFAESLTAAYSEFSGPQKDHYMFLYFFLHYRDFSSGHFPAFFSSFAPVSSLPALTKKIPRTSEFTTFLQTVTDPETINLLTYSTIPSVYRFFTTTHESKHFIKVLSKISDPSLHDQYARSLFSSPLFLHFITIVFQPILSPLVSKSTIPSAHDLGKQIERAWTDNIPQLPGAFVKFLQEQHDPARTLSKSFFEIALKPDHARLFGLVEFYQTLADPLLSTLLSILTVTGSKCILSQLIQESPQKPKVFLLSISSRRACPALFQPLVLTDPDFAIFSLAFGLAKPQTPKTYNPVALRRPEDRIDNIAPPPIELDLPPAIAGLRSLLLLADPLPEFEDCPQCPLKQFIHAFLIQRGPRASLFDRSAAADQLDLKKSTEDSLLDILREVPLQATPELETLSAYTRIVDKLVELADTAAGIRLQVRRVFETLVITEQCKVSLAPCREFRAYLDNPGALVGDCLSRIEGLKAPIVANGTAIVHACLTSKFDFGLFQTYKTGIGEADDTVSAYLKENSEELLSEFAFHDVFYEIVRSVAGNEDVGKLVEDAVAESNPLRKLEKFNAALVEVVGEAEKAFAAVKRLTEKDQLAILSGFVVAANPPSLVSNRVYLGEFCPVALLKPVFDGFVANPITVIDGILKGIKEIDLAAFTKVG
jgi:hypothetical protein